MAKALNKNVKRNKIFAKMLISPKGVILWEAG
jgi:hypothetical protein